MNIWQLYIQITSPCTLDHKINSLEIAQATFATHGISELLVSAMDRPSPVQSLRNSCSSMESGTPLLHLTTQQPLVLQRERFRSSRLTSRRHQLLEDLISWFLLAYRITQYSTTGTSRAELLFSRRPCTRLDLVLPGLSSRVHANQHRQKQAHDQHTKHRFFRNEDAVFVCDLPSKKDWLPGTICRSLGSRSYLIRLQDGRTVRRQWIT